MIVIIMGVSASGKTTIGKALGRSLNTPFYDADDFHPESNVQKMASGESLNDSDRAPWLKILSQKIMEWKKEDGAILACSALKEKYRETLEASNKDSENIKWVYLDVDKETLLERLNSRSEHFFPPELLDSQLSTLEIPKDAIKVNATAPIKEIILALTTQLS